MINKFLHYGHQFIEEDDIQAVVKALKSDFLTTGPEVKGFEKEFAEFCGAKYAVSCSNGTTALYMAYSALGLKACDIVITTPLTFLATASAAAMLGAKIFFSDIDPNTLNLDPKKVINLLENLTPETRHKVKAIMPVHFGGNPVDVEAFFEISNKFNIQIIDDACHALGAEYQTKDKRYFKVGNANHTLASVFSLHPIKHITTGEGGVITTSSEVFYNKLLQIRNHAMVTTKENWLQNNMALDSSGTPNPWYYELHEPGLNFRITDFQCALGRSQLKKIDKFVKKRIELAACYRKQCLSPFSNTNGF